MDGDRGWRDSVARWWQWLGGRRIAVVALGVPGAVFVAWWLLRVPPVPIESALPFSDAVVLPVPGSPPSSTRQSHPSARPEVTHIHVHVVGAVVTPGVYALPVGSRGIDALQAAGGALPSADLVHINLAVPLVDAVQMFVPHRGERRHPTTTVPRRDAIVGAPGSPDVVAPVPGMTPVDSSPVVATVSGRVRLNSATAKELDALPGVGPTTAAAIVEHRRRNGPFRSVDDLDAVNGIGPARIAALRDLVVID
jgi:competence protein ComEA